MGYRHNLMRMLSGIIWFMIPVLSLMLFLPHQVRIDYQLALVLLFFALLVNLVTMLLPFRESLLQRNLGLLMSFLRIALIILLCAAVHFTGGVRSPLFAFLLLVAAFATTLYSPLSSSVLISGITVGAYLVTVLVFSSLHREDIQLVCAQVFFFLLITFFVNRLSAESREQAHERTRAMEELRNLSEIDRATSSFVSAVSFEMRTPLTSIQGFSEILASQQLEPEKEQEYVEIISREADNLTRLVEDLLDISRMESGKVRLNKEVARLGQLLKMSLPALTPACDPSEVALDIPSGLPGVLVDAQRMKRVFDAIFSYIVRKSGRGSEVRASAKTEGQEVVITINFRNLETEARYENGGRLFPSFGAQDKEDLELAMAHRIVLAHNGSVNLIQASGGWSAIVLRLPELTARDFIGPQTPGGTFQETST